MRKIASIIALLVMANLCFAQGKSISTKRSKIFVDATCIHQLRGNLSPALGVTGTYDYKLNPNLLIGGGIGVIANLDCSPSDSYPGTKKVTFPIFADFRGTLDKKSTPFIDLKAGYAPLLTNGAYINLSIGYRFGFKNGQAINCSAGYNFRTYKYKGELGYRTYTSAYGGKMYYHDYYEVNNTEKINALSISVGYEF